MKLIPIHGLSIRVFLIAVCASAFATCAVAQTPSTTSITASPSPLVLPGTLNLGSVVNQTPAGGVPTGTVTFLDGATPLGPPIPLAFIPASQIIPSSPSVATPTYGTNPVGLASVILPASTKPYLVGIDSVPDPASGLYVNTVTLYNLTAGFTTPVTYNYVMLYPYNFSPSDAIASGYFLNSKSSGIQSFVVHTPGSYSVFDGSLMSIGSSVTLSTPKSSGASCGCSNPDNETIAIDDFDGDGYSDIASLRPKTTFSEGFPITPLTGVAINDKTGGFPAQFVATPTPNGLNTFCATAIATGHFAPSAGAQLAVLGKIPATGSCDTATQADPASIYVFTLTNTGGPNGINQLTQIGTGIVVDPSAVAIAAADMDRDGNTDLVVSQLSSATIAYGDGSGNFPRFSTPVTTPNRPFSLTIGDFNGDGYPDVAFLSGSNLQPAPDGFGVLYNDGTGNLIGVLDANATAGSPIAMTAADLNLDGLPDIAVLLPPAVQNGVIDIRFDSGSAQAALTTGASALAAGTHSLTASYSGDSNYAPSTAAPLTEVVSQTVPILTWPAPAAIEYGTSLSGAQLNAVPSVPGSAPTNGLTYTPGAGAILPPGTNKLNVVFVPADTFDYAGATASQSITVATPSLTSIAPASAKLFDPDTVLTVTGLGFVGGATVQYNGTPLVTTYVDQHNLTAVVTAALLTTTGTAAITVADPGGITVTGSQTFTVDPAPAVVTVSAPTTVATQENSTITLQINPYPAPITATLTLGFVPTAPNTVGDIGIIFPNNSTTETLAPIPADSTASVPVPFESGSTAGTITVTVKLVANGVDVTPASLVPVAISVPAQPPTGNATITRSGKSFSVIFTGLSSTREMTQATYHFTAAAGKSLKTTDITVQLSTAFQTFYQGDAATGSGTNFTYTQPFAIDGDAGDVASVTVTLSNSQGSAQPQTVQ